MGDSDDNLLVDASKIENVNDLLELYQEIYDILGFQTVLSVESVEKPLYKETNIGKWVLLPTEKNSWKEEVLH